MNGGIANLVPGLRQIRSLWGGAAYHTQSSGKGGLLREVNIASELAEMLESRILAEPVTVTDRGIHYQQYYAISAGQSWSRSFSNASTRALGWSAGSHGTRHSYARERMAELQDYGCSYDESLEVVSQKWAILEQKSPKLT